RSGTSAGALNLNRGHGDFSLSSLFLSHSQQTTNGVTYIRRFPIMLGLAGAVLAASAISASAQQPLRHAGKLECVGGPSLGFVVGSGSTLHCTLHQNRRRPQHYDAVVRRVGVDLGLTERW